MSLHLKEKTSTTMKNLLSSDVNYEPVFRFDATTVDFPTLKRWVRDWWIESVALGRQLPLGADMRYFHVGNRENGKMTYSVTPFLLPYGWDYVQSYDDAQICFVERYNSWLSTSDSWWRYVSLSALSDAFHWWLLGPKFSVVRKDSQCSRFAMAFSDLFGKAHERLTQYRAVEYTSGNMRISRAQPRTFYRFPPLGIYRSTIFKKYPWALDKYKAEDRYPKRRNFVTWNFSVPRNHPMDDPESPWYLAMERLFLWQGRGPQFVGVAGTSYHEEIIHLWDNMYNSITDPVDFSSEFSRHRPEDAARRKAVAAATIDSSTCNDVVPPATVAEATT